MAKTIEYTDQETGIKFSMTGKWPIFGKEEVAKNMASQIVDAVSEIRTGEVFRNSVAQKLESVRLDMAVTRQCRFLDFEFGPCIVDFTGSVPRYELAVHAPSGDVNPLIFEANRIQYRDIDVPIDLQRMLIEQVFGGDARLPFDVILGNGYFLQREMKFVKDHLSLIEQIVNKSVIENGVWEHVSPKGRLVRMTLHLEEKYSGIQMLTDTDYGSLIVLGQKEVYARTMGTARVCVTTYGVDNGITIATDKAVDVIELSKDGKYGFFAVDAFEGGNIRHHQNVAISDGKTTIYHPSIGSGDMQTENTSCVSIPFIVNCKPGDVKVLNARVEEYLKTLGNAVFTPRYQHSFDPERGAYMGLVQMPVGCKLVTDYRGAVGKVHKITDFLTESVGARALPDSEQLKMLPS